MLKDESKNKYLLEQKFYDAMRKCVYVCSQKENEMILSTASCTFEDLKNPIVKEALINAYEKHTKQSLTFYLK